MYCEVSWKMGTHTSQLEPCRNEASFLAFGIGNEGDSSFAVCGNHSQVAALHPDLWAIEPLAAEGAD